jgi:hypothetical protein
LCLGGGQGWRLAQRAGGFGQARADHEASFRPWDHQAGVFELAISGDDGVEAELALRGQSAQRRQARADGQPTAVDGVGHFIGEGLVEVGCHGVPAGICNHADGRTLALYPLPGAA